MKSFLLKAIELILVFVCRTFVLIIKVLDWFMHLAALVCFMFLLAWSIEHITVLSPFWQIFAVNFFVYGSVFIFLSIIILFFWKPKKFYQIFDL